MTRPLGPTASASRDRCPPPPAVTSTTVAPLAGASSSRVSRARTGTCAMEGPFQRDPLEAVLLEEAARLVERAPVRQAARVALIPARLRPQLDVLVDAGPHDLAL